MEKQNINKSHVRMHDLVVPKKGFEQEFTIGKVTGFSMLAHSLGPLIHIMELETKREVKLFAYSLDRLVREGVYTKKLEKVTHWVQVNPSCASIFRVRLVGKDTFRIDGNLPPKTKDVLGHGQTLEEAARDAWIKKFGTDESDKSEK